MSWSVETYVLEVHGLAVDAHHRRRNPVRELARLNHTAHQAGDEGAVFAAREPLVLLAGPFGFADDPPIRRNLDARQRADVAVEGLVRRRQAVRQAGLLEHLVPAADAGHRVLDEVVA